LSSVLFSSIFAEGSKELAPNAQISINGQMTTDIAALNIGNDEYRNFAEFNNSDENARLHIYISDPTTESIYLGFSAGHSNSYQNGNFPVSAPSVDYIYYVKDPNGNIVYTSPLIDGSNANITNWQEAVNGPDVFNAGGYSAEVLDPSVLTNQGNATAGNYYIEFELKESPEPSPKFLLIDFWDITVANNNVPRTGRIWSRNWGLFAVNDYGFPERPFNGAFYVCAPDPADPSGSYITKIDFNNSGFRPGGFNVLFNSFGTDKNALLEESRKSVMGDSSGSGNVAEPEYDIYLNDPIDICETAEAGMIQLNGVTTCDGNANYCISYLTDKPGTINLLLDFDGDDDIYTPGTADIIMSKTLGMSEVGIDQCFDWDGLDGNGEVVDDIKIILSYEQGQYHFPIYDAEYLSEGFMIERVRPAGPTPKLFYDDSNIVSDPLTTGPQPAKVELSGCTTPCHNWDNYTGTNNVGFGNWNTINSWWFSNRLVERRTVEFPAVLFCDISGDNQICEGQSGSLQLNFEHTPSSSAMPIVSAISWSGPGIVSGGNSEIVTVNASGVYLANVEWITPTDDICSSVCEFEVSALETITTVTEETVTCLEEFEVDGEIYEASQDTLIIRNFTTNDGCMGTDSLFITVETPAINLSCDLVPLSSSLCAGDTTLINVVLNFDSTVEFINEETVTYSFSDNIIEEFVDFDNAEFSATVTGGEVYTFELSYQSECTGEMYTTFCETAVEVNETVNTKVDTTVECSSIFVFGGVEYLATRDTVLTQTITDTNGCTFTDSLCVTVAIPNQTITCEMFGDDGACEGDTAFVSVDFEFDATFGFPVFVDNYFSDNVFDQTVSFGDEIRVWGYVIAGEEATFTLVYENDCTGAIDSTTCSFFVEEYQNAETKVDIALGFGESTVIDGVTYDQDTVVVQNLNTINGCDSIVTTCVVVEIPDVSLTCNISGPDGVCLSENGALVLSTTHTPANAPVPTINSITWTGGGINSVTSDQRGANVQGGYNYSVDISYTNVAGETRSTSCEIFVDSYPEYQIEIDTIIETGQTLNINGNDYITAGEYIDAGLTSNGCDSTVIIRIVEESTLLCYDLNNCKSTDYSRFTPQVADDFNCADIYASTVFRENPDVNGHSCTEGVNGTNAMCISSEELCTFAAGSDKSAVIEVTINPTAGENVRITSMNFFEKAPERYEWIAGHEGQNNYPTLYGVRVLKNNVEIYRSEEHATTFDWTFERFSFGGNTDFLIDGPSVLRFELLGYCTIGNGANVTAWDLDEIKINATCTAASANQITISGSINDIKGEALEQVKVSLITDNPNLSSTTYSYTDNNGGYAFTELKKGYDYQVKPELNENHLRGVTTADLIHIQRHILGLAQFESPYQLIAADADKSESISAIDLIQLRKLILGIHTELPNNTSYRFASTNQELSIDNPWSFDEDNLVLNAEDDQNTNFNAIKVGDVTAFVSLDSDAVIESRNSRIVSLNTENEFIKESEIKQIDLKLNTNSDVEGMQFALQLNTSQFVSIEGIDDDSYNFDANTNVLKVSWLNTNDLDEVEFRLNVIANKDAWVSELITLNESEIAPSVYIGSEVLDHKLNLKLNTENMDDFISVNPNPFSESFNIDINSEKSAMYGVDVFDVSGKLLFRSQNDLVKGMQTKIISKSDIGNYKGVIIVKVSSKDSVTVKRILSL